MNKVAVHAPTKWRAIGLELKLTTAALNRIEINHGTDTNRCFEEVFDAWEKSATRPYTWATIIQALRAPQTSEQKLAAYLEKNFAR